MDYDVFQKECASFLTATRSNNGDAWHWIKAPCPYRHGYLELRDVPKRRNMQQQQQQRQSNDVTAAAVGDDDDELIEDMDISAMPPSSSEWVFYSYHIVYSQSYRVPVLMMSVCNADGSSLTLNDVWDMIPMQHSKRLQHDKWTFITQTEHPVLGLPFFQVHPCRTNDLMTVVTSTPSRSTSELDSNNDDDDDNGNGGGTANNHVEHVGYIPSWLSLIGDVVGIKIQSEVAASTVSSYQKRHS